MFPISGVPEMAVASQQVDYFLTSGQGQAGGIDLAPVIVPSAM
jgi:hypothetical protein